MKTYHHPPMEDVTLPAVMQALADPCRVAIVRELLTRDVSLACHEVPLEISKATRSHHFDVLRQAGIIHTQSEGTKCMTSLRKKELDQRFPGLLKLVETEPHQCSKS
ncbi:helix-turn-helix domain-containing protein [Verrucomicrobium sp. BvORR034]|jgi:DNA-binding transcriptional ArsR family regulator|uniref:ArsR/SmtB family transcription factor n=1 Tax=Verrucomicrobium sp. BvORR034 TaxID=1396418 RepID=UPI0006788A52|nr:helix-turn-helix domain-containing protein [Verrucomicrobium sp. BvORR034]